MIIQDLMKDSEEKEKGDSTKNRLKSGKVHFASVSAEDLNIMSL